METKKANYLIGCSGYYYSQWKGSFYPKGVPPSKWLQHYSTQFNTVELNNSFYRIPQLSNLKKQFSATPEDFKFSVKVNKQITHVMKLKKASQLIKDFRDLMQEGYADKLHKFLFQMPPSFHFTAENLELLNNIEWEDNSVIEFRHSSWWNKDVKELLQNKRCSFCNVDYPGLQVDFMNTTSDFYLRLHGSPDLFKSSYSPAQLEDFYEKMPRGFNSYTIYFNNTYYDAAYKNASELIEIINRSD
jgi:uncharacterized protein YecE (DUF72 family)